MKNETTNLSLSDIATLVVDLTPVFEKMDIVALIDLHDDLAGVVIKSGNLIATALVPVLTRIIEVHGFKWMG